MNVARPLMVGTVFVVLCGCAAPLPQEGEQKLASGIQSYENGKYGEAAMNLQSSLDLGLGKSDRVKAHKYLAFIYCGSGQQAPCLKQFRMALAIDGSFELNSAEAGHPIWGPIFRQAKARR